MSWRDDSAKVSIKLGGKTRTVIGGSFRGVPFLVEQSNTSGGRRVATHEALPYGNERDGAAWNEDVGRVPRSVSVTAYLVGDDYMDQKVALQEALEGYGPAALVDPWNGTYPAASCTNYSISESRDDGGYCQISMDFSIADPETLQKSVCKTSDSVQETAAARSKLREVACAAFAVAKSTVGYPNDVAGKVLDATNEVLDGVAAIRDFVRDIAAFEDTLAAICVNLRILWSTPDILASDIAMLFDSGENLSSAYADILTSIVQQPAPELEVHGPETPQTLGAKKDARAFSAFVSRLALAELGLVLVSEERDSSERALADAESFSKLVAAAIAETTDPDLTDALQELGAVVYEAVVAVASSLPEVQEVTARGGETPSACWRRPSRGTPRSTIPASSRRGRRWKSRWGSALSCHPNVEPLHGPQRPDLFIFAKARLAHFCALGRYAI